MKCRECGWEFRRKQRTENIATLLGELELMLLRNMEHSGGYNSREFRRGSLIEGRFVYTVGNKPIASAHTKTGAYVGENRKSDAIFCVTGSHEFVEQNASAPTVQLQSIRVVLDVIAYR